MAEPRPLRQITTGNAPEDDRYRQLTEGLREPLLCPLLIGRMVTVELPAAGDVVVNHLLGRQPMGYIVVDQTVAAPSFFRAAWDVRTLTFTSAVASTVTLWVF